MEPLSPPPAARVPVLGGIGRWVLEFAGSYLQSARSPYSWNSAFIERVKPNVTDWNKSVIDEFHAKRGKDVGRWGDNLLLLTTRGAKSGQVRTTPVVYHRDGNRYVIAASKGGAPTHPGWYHNLAKHREAEIEVGTEKFKVRATPIPKGAERDRLYEAHGDVFAGFRDYPKKTKRVIPVVVLERIR